MKAQERHIVRADVKALKVVGASQHGVGGVGVLGGAVLGVHLHRAVGRNVVSVFRGVVPRSYQIQSSSASRCSSLSSAAEVVSEVSSEYGASSDSELGEGSAAPPPQAERLTLSASRRLRTAIIFLCFILFLLLFRDFYSDDTKKIHVTLLM